MGAIPRGALTAALGLRSRPGVAVGAVLILTLAGCSGTILAHQDRLPCIPPGLPPIAAWVAFNGQAVALRGRDERHVFAVVVEYRIGTTRARGLWIGRDLVLVDPDTDDATRPMWRDRGALDASGIVQGAPTCDWVEDPGRRA